MSDLANIEQSIEGLLALPPYAMPPGQRHDALLPLLKQELAYACECKPSFRNYVDHWPADFRTAQSIADLPYLPAAMFKGDPPLALIASSQVTRTLTSSATGSQVPSRVVLDSITARRLTKGIVTIIRNFIGPARRPYLVVDTKENLAAQNELGARAAAIQALFPFATEAVCCLGQDRWGDSTLNLETLLHWVEEWKSAEVLVYGFTHVLWTRLVQPLQSQNIRLHLPNVHVLHSGGWKRLEQTVTKKEFSQEIAAVFGCPPERVIDYYGMVENVGVVYPDCEYGNKHVPAFAEVVVRDPLTLAPTMPGQQGLVQTCSVLPTSFPGFLVLTDDMAEIIGTDGCGCGRRGTYFRFARRVPKAEVRGCGNLETTRVSAASGSDL